MEKFILVLAIKGIAYAHGPFSNEENCYQFNKLILFDMAYQRSPEQFVSHCYTETEFKKRFPKLKLEQSS